MNKTGDLKGLRYGLFKNLFGRTVFKVNLVRLSL